MDNLKPYEQVWWPPLRALIRQYRRAVLGINATELIADICKMVAQIKYQAYEAGRGAEAIELEAALDIMRSRMKSAKATGGEFSEGYGAAMYDALALISTREELAYIKGMQE